VKSAANYLSIARMLLAITLIFVKPLSIAFFIIYLACGISDAFDGYVARKTGTASKLGEKLDSIADFMMVMVLIVLLYPFINLKIQIIIWIVIIGFVKIAAVIVAFIKYKTLGMLHTYSNKITGFMLFAFPLTLSFAKSDVLVYIICAAASISAIEELVIDISSKKFEANKKSIFW
jgi:phosphatidylglycerophosphate synthase